MEEILLIAAELLTRLCSAIDSTTRFDRPQNWPITVSWADQRLSDTRIAAPRPTDARYVQPVHPVPIPVQRSIAPNGRSQYTLSLPHKSGNGFPLRDSCPSRSPKSPCIL